MEGDDRADSLKLTRRLKMARSAHAYAYVRGNTQQLYGGLDASPTSVPQGPPIWICSDRHLGNLGPLADVRGEVDVQIRDLDQTVIGKARCRSRSGSNRSTSSARVCRSAAGKLQWEAGKGFALDTGRRQRPTGR